jgi:hypothetical protein
MIFSKDTSLEKLIGEFKNNMANGVGTLIWKDGSKYQGEWKDDVKHGMGKLTWPSGDVSYGPFKNDKRHGTHDYTYADGTKKKILYEKGEQIGQ